MSAVRETYLSGYFIRHVDRSLHRYVYVQYRRMHTYDKVCAIYIRILYPSLLRQKIQKEYFLREEVGFVVFATKYKGSI